MIDDKILDKWEDELREEHRYDKPRSFDRFVKIVSLIKAERRQSDNRYRRAKEAEEREYELIQELEKERKAKKRLESNMVEICVESSGSYERVKRLACRALVEMKDILSDK